MPFKKKPKNDIATTKKVEEETKKVETHDDKINLLEVNEATREYIYNERIINELIAIRTAILELHKAVKEE